MKEYRVSWYVFIDDKGGIEGRTLLRGDRIEVVLAKFKEKLSKKYYVRHSLVYIVDAVEIE